MRIDSSSTRYLTPATPLATLGTPQPVKPEYSTETLDGKPIRTEQLQAPASNMLQVQLGQAFYDQARAMAEANREAGNVPTVNALAPVRLDSPYTRNPILTHIPKNAADEVGMYASRLQDLAGTAALERKLGSGVTIVVDQDTGQYHALRNAGHRSASDWLRMTVEDMKSLNDDGRFDKLIADYGPMTGVRV
ncbi:MAG TPA: hypothetical protein VIT92_08285 [Burkholderiaceae bacterium]